MSSDSNKALLNHLLKTPLNNLSSVTATAINSTLLVLSELRKRDPAGAALDPATLNARIKAAAQAAVKAATAKLPKNKRHSEFPKNLKDLTELVNSQTAVAAALLGSSKKKSTQDPVEPMLLEDLLDVNRLQEILSTGSFFEHLKQELKDDSSYVLKIPKTSFRKHQLKKSQKKWDLDNLKSAVRKSKKPRLRNTTLATSSLTWLSPELRPMLEVEYPNDEFTSLNLPQPISLPSAITIEEWEVFHEFEFHTFV